MRRMFTRNLYQSPAGDDGAGSAGKQDTASQSPAGDPDDSSGDSGNKFVSAEAYERIQSDMVKWKKRARENEAKVNEWESEKKSREENKALEEKRYLELLEQQKAENETLKSNLGALEKNWQDAQKYSEINRHLGNNFDQQYAGLIPFEEIEVTEDGKVDPESAKRVAEGFKQKHPRLFMSPSTQPPGHYPNGSGKKISASEFAQLGSSKKMIENVQDRFPELFKKP